MLLPISPPTQKTLAAYSRVVHTLKGHAGRIQASGRLTEVHDTNLLLALVWDDLQPRISAASARQYRAALVKHIEAHPGESDEAAMEVLLPEDGPAQIARDDRIAEARAELRKRRRGAQQRACQVSADDWQLLISALMASRGGFGAVAALWLRATRIAGLRPCEWWSARIEWPSLVVQNAKASQGRSHGSTRRLALAQMPPDEIDAIRQCIRMLSLVPEDDRGRVYHRVRDLIADVARAALSPRERYPALYTGRHLFAASAKAAYAKAEVAAMMGHASEESAGRHYARASSAAGGRPMTIRAHPADVAAVQQLKAAKLALRMLAGLKRTTSS